MNLYYAQNLYGLLSTSKQIEPDASQGCRTVEHKGSLFCVYLTGDGTQVKLICKPPAADWDTSLPATNRTSTQLPALVSFNGTLYMAYLNEQNKTVICRFLERSKTFAAVSMMHTQLSETPAFAELNSVLHMFYKVDNSPNLFHKSTVNLSNWENLPQIKSDGVSMVLTSVSPVATTYQNVIHLIYKDREDHHCYLLKSDGFSWSANILLTTDQYPHSPGITLHNGLLKLAFAGEDNSLHQYSYDGNAVSPRLSSTVLDCGSASPSLAVQNGALVAVYSK